MTDTSLSATLPVRLERAEEKAGAVIYDTAVEPGQ